MWESIWAIVTEAEASSPIVAQPVLDDTGATVLDDTSATVFDD